MLRSTIGYVIKRPNRRYAAGVGCKSRDDIPVGHSRGDAFVEGNLRDPWQGIELTAGARESNQEGCNRPHRAYALARDRRSEKRAKDQLPFG